MSDNFSNIDIINSGWRYKDYEIYKNLSIPKDFELNYYGGSTMCNGKSIAVGIGAY